MKKPDNEFGTGVSFVEMCAAIKAGASKDSAYCQLLLAAAVEKLRCIQKADSIKEVRGIVIRPEWVKDVEGLSK